MRAKGTIVEAMPVTAKLDHDTENSLRANQKESIED